MRYNYYYTNIVRANLLSKNLYSNPFELPIVTKATLNITLINDNIDEDIELIKSLLLLEFLVGSRAYVKNFKAVYRSKTKSLIFVVAVNTRKAKLMNFIDLFVSSGIPFFESRYVKINEKINNKSATYSLGWKDMNVFHNIPEAFYKWELTLNVNFTLRKIRDLCLNDNSCYADLIQQCHLNQASAYIEDEQQESDGELQLSNDTWEQKIQDDLLI